MVYIINIIKHTLQTQNPPFQLIELRKFSAVKISQDKSSYTEEYFPLSTDFPTTGAPTGPPIQDGILRGPKGDQGPRGMSSSS